MSAARLSTVALVAALALVEAGCGGKPIADPAAVVALFATGSQASDRSMHIEASGRLRTQLFETAFRTSYDFHGTDFRGHATLDTPALGDLGRFEADVMRVADVGFSRVGDRDWTIGGGLPRDPFAGVTAATASAGSTESRNGQTVLHVLVSAPDALAGALGLSTDQVVQDATALTGSYDVAVDAKGVPVSAKADVEGLLTGDVSGPFSATVTFVVSAWGAGTALVPPFPVNTFPPGTTFVADNGTAETLTWRDAMGHELAVPPCSRASSATFDGRSFTVSNEAGAVVDRTEPGSLATWMWGFEGSGGSGEDGGLPYTATMAPCLAAP